jgi:CheY-like chemotaxis protein
MTQPFTVLVVDDDPVVRETAVHLFQSLGFEVLDTYNGPDALRLIQNHPRISLLFTDVRMPRMDGVSLAEAAQDIRPGLKVVFTSGYVDSKALPPGTPFVPKPWSADDLASAVDPLLQMRGSTR